MRLRSNTAQENTTNHTTVEGGSGQPHGFENEARNKSRGWENGMGTGEIHQTSSRLWVDGTCSKSFGHLVKNDSHFAML